MEWITQNYLVSTDKDLLQVSKIHDYLSTQAYWCLGIPKETIKKAIEGSLCFGLYQYALDSKRIQIGFARVVTDQSTFAWLCDVYIEEKHQKQGLAKWLIECVMSHPELQNLRRICLTTKDAHGLYEKFGFKVTSTPESWMEIKDNDLYKKGATAQNAHGAVSDAFAYGIDVSLVESNLLISPQERMERHESAFELATELRRAGEHLSKT